MVSKSDKWIRIFDIPETSSHKKGFTLYKVISMLYPESNPDAVIKVTVWKRYNEFKHLHKDIKQKYLTLNINKKIPSLSSSAYFKRFNKNVIKERQSAILGFLEFIANIPELYTSTEFVDFFKSSQTTNDGGSISSIRAELNLPEDPEYFPLYIPSSDDECTISSDTDSIMTISSSLQATEVDFNKCNNSDNASTSLKNDLQDSISLSTTSASNESVQAEIEQFYASIGNDVADYILDASHHINLAVQCESEQKFEEAYNEYKLAIDILLTNAKLDCNIDRRQMVKYQIDKYILRAEKIYNLHLSNEIRNIKEIAIKYNATEITKSLSDLHKYKVLKVIDDGMLVLHLEIQKLYYVKVIQKTMIFSYDDLILPDDVPFMVRLENYYISENAIFFILEYCDGTKLCDYVRQRCLNIGNNFYNKTNNSDNESECSYTDLLNEYASYKIANNYNNNDKVNVEQLPESDINDLQEDVYNVDYENVKRLNSRKSSIWSNEDFDLEHLVPVQYVIKWSAQLLLALEKLHGLGVIVNNLDMRNLLINQKEDIVLTYQCKVTNYYNIQHELNFINKTLDRMHLWSFGIILYELLVGMPISKTHPNGLNPFTVLYIPKYVTPEGRSLLKQLLSSETAKCGINEIEDIKMHPFYNSISWESLLSQFRR